MATTVLVAPTLRSINSDDIVVFLQEYDRYKKEVEEANKNRAQKDRIPLKSLTSCISERISGVIYDFGVRAKIDNRINENRRKIAVENMTRSYLESKIGHKGGYSDARLSIARSLSEISMDLENDDGSDRVLQFIAEVRVILQKNGMSHITTNPSRYGNIVGTMLRIDGCIQPREVRAAVRVHMDGQLENKIDETAFMELLDEKTELVLKVQNMRKQAKEFGYFSSSSKRTQRDSRSSNSGRDGPKRSKDRSDRRSPACFGCSGNHKLNVCPVVTKPEERAKFIKIWQDTRNKKVNSSYSGLSNSTHEKSEETEFRNSRSGIIHISPDLTEGTPNISGTSLKEGLKPYYRLRQLTDITGDNVSLEDTVCVSFGSEKIVSARAILDSGTDRTVVSSSLLRKLQTHEHVDVLSLTDPLRLELADGKNSMQATKIAIMDLHFQLKTGSIALRRCECLVVEDNLENPLIGRLELQSLDVDPKTNLERLLSRTEDDEEEIQQEEDFDLYHVEVGENPRGELQSILIEKVKEAEGKEVPKVKFVVGDQVRLTAGPFANFTGTIEEIDLAEGKLKVSVFCFGRFTPVDLEFWQVEAEEG